MNAFGKRLVRFSAALSFTGSKCSLLLSAVTMATVVSMKFQVAFPVVCAALLILGVVAVLVVVKSGWYTEEMEHLGRKWKAQEGGK